MAAVNYYIGLARTGGGGATDTPYEVVAGTTSAGTAVDVELRMQTNNGTNATGLTRKDVALAVNVLMQFLYEGGVNHAGANLPPPP